jgi:hypothetical protein
LDNVEKKTSKALVYWHKFDGFIGMGVVAVALFSGGMTLQALLDSTERANLNSQIAQAKLDSTDPKGPTQKLIAQLNQRVSEQAATLGQIGASCRAAATSSASAAVSSDKAAKVKAPIIIVPKAAVAKAAVAKAASAALDEAQLVNRSTINSVIINRKLHK